jgi:hypothetical protein
MVLAVADDNGRRFGHHCCRRTNPNSIKLEAGINKLISTLIYSIYQIALTSALEQTCAAHPSGGMGSSNPRRWRGERLQHHGDVVYRVVCAYCAVSDS